MTVRFVLLAVTLTASAALAACAPAPTEAEVEAAEWRYTGVGSSMFLSAHGLGSKAESLAYYGATLGGTSSSAYTLDKWKSQFIGDAGVVTALYRNASELGFWREMTCTDVVARGVGGCSVTNWDAPNDIHEGKPNKGTVAMNVSAEGFTRFYVFLPDGRLSPSAVLDEEGPKFAPRLCTVCHSGSSPKPGENPDLGSVFREFEPDLLEARPDISRVTAEQEWFRLNRVVAQANLAIRGESEGAPRGTDHAKRSVNDRIEALYIPGGEPDALPPSWAAADDDAKALWKHVIVPYCLNCHRHNAYDWTNYKGFEPFRGPYLRNYLPNAPDPEAQVTAMPQSSLAFSLLKKDKAAQSALAIWLGEKKPESTYQLGGKSEDGVAPGSLYIDDDVVILVNDKEVVRETTGFGTRPPFRLKAVPGDVVTMRFFDTLGGARGHAEVWLAGPNTPPQRVAQEFGRPSSDYPAQPRQPFDIAVFTIPKAGESSTPGCLPDEPLDTASWPAVSALTVREATTKRYRARWSVSAHEYDFTADCDGWISDTFVTGAGKTGWVGWNTVTNEIRVSRAGGDAFDATIGRAAAEYAKKTLFPAADMSSLKIVTD